MRTINKIVGAALLLCIAGCAPKQVDTAGVLFPKVDGVTLLKNPTNVELLGAVSGTAKARYRGCKGLTEQAYTGAAGSVLKLGGTAIGEVKVVENPQFLIYYWGCRVDVTGEAYRYNAQ
jgi:hypothetical protein